MLYPKAVDYALVRNPILNAVLTASAALVVVFGWTLGAQSATFQTKAQQAILMDYATGAVLFQKDADKLVPQIGRAHV